MKNNKVLGSIAVLAIAALTAFNVNMNSQENGLSDVSLDNVEALANENDNHWSDWLTQGLTKDERAYTVSCQWNWEFDFGFFSWGESGSGTKQLCSSGGSDNCSVGSCS